MLFNSLEFLIFLPIVFILLLSIILKPIEKNYLEEYLNITQNNINIEKDTNNIKNLHKL